MKHLTKYAIYVTSKLVREYNDEHNTYRAADFEFWSLDFAKRWEEDFQKFLESELDLEKFEGFLAGVMCCNHPTLLQDIAHGDFDKWAYKYCQMFYEGKDMEDAFYKVKLIEEKIHIMADNRISPTQ